MDGDMFPFSTDNKNSILKIVWYYVFDFSRKFNRKAVLCMAVFGENRNKLNKSTVKQIEHLYRISDDRL